MLKTTICTSNDILKKQTISLTIESDTSVAITTTIGTFFISTGLIICLSIVFCISFIIINIIMVFIVNKKM